jgi:hypothetical protein
MKQRLAVMQAFFICAGPSAQSVHYAATMKTEKQKKLTQDHADFVIEYEAAKAKGIALGTFLAWRHAHNRDGITIDDSRKR